MLLLVEVPDAVTSLIILTELGLILFGVELGRVVPRVFATFELVDCMFRCVSLDGARNRM